MMAKNIKAVHFSFAYIQRRFALAVYFYVCFRLQKPTERHSFSTIFTEESSPLSVESHTFKNNHRFLKTSFIFDNDVKSVTSSTSFEKRPQWDKIQHGSAVPFESSTKYRIKSSLLKNECDYYDCSFTSLRELFFNGTHFSAGFISTPEEMPWQVSPKVSSHGTTDQMLSNLGFPFSDQNIGFPTQESISRSVAKLYQRSFITTQLPDSLQNIRRLQKSWASRLNRKKAAIKIPGGVSFPTSVLHAAGPKASARTDSSAATAKSTRASKPVSIEEAQSASKFISSTDAFRKPLPRPSSLPLKPSPFFSAVHAAKGRLDIPVMDMNIAALKSSMDDGNIQKVIDVLQNNIKQWSFIESQLLEPNANLGMPEIFIPLRHLTTTLEILGNILYMKNEFLQAKEYLERACPLIELLPPSITMSGFSVDSEEGYGASLHDMQKVGSFRAFDEGGSLSFNPGTGDANQRNKYAEGCYALLREVYGKIYKQQEGKRPGPEKSVHKPKSVQRRRQRCSKSRGGSEGNSINSRRARDVDDSQMRRTSTSCDNASADQDDLGDSYCDEPTRDVDRKSDKTGRRDFDDFYEDDSVIESSDDDYYDDREDGDDRKDNCSSFSDDGECDQLSSSDMEQNFSQKIEELRIPFEHLRSDHSPPPSSSLPAQRGENRLGLRKRRDYIPQAQRRHTMLEPEASQSAESNNNGIVDKRCDLPKDDLANPLLARPEALQGGFGKVTSTWPKVDNEILVNTESSSGGKSTVTVPVSSDIGGKIATRRRHRLSEGTLLRMTSMSSTDSGMEGDVLLLEIDEETGLPSRLPSAAHVSSHSSASSPHSLFAAFHSLGLDSEGFHNSATSVIAGDLEDMLRTFVLEDSYGRENVLSIARKYYDDLDINFPNMDYTEYAANMDLGQVFLEVMGAVNEKGFSFIGPELEKWQELGQVILASTLPPSKERSGDPSDNEPVIAPESGNCEDDYDGRCTESSTSDECTSDDVGKSDSRQKKYRYQNSEIDSLRKSKGRVVHSKAKREVEDDDVYLDEEDDGEKIGDYSESSDAGEEYVDRGDNGASAGRYGSIRYSESGEIELDLDGSYFNSFSLSDRNRLLVLSAFDIASNTESFETFDLRLGLALGIVDNDKSRSAGSSSQKMHIMSLPSQFHSSQPESSSSKMHKSSKPLKVDKAGSSDSSQPFRDGAELKSHKPRRRKYPKTPSDTPNAGDENHENESEVVEDDGTKSFKEEPSLSEKRGRKRAKRRAEPVSEDAEMDDMNEKVNIIPEEEPSDLQQHSYEEDASESIGVPPLLRSAIPTLKSESVLASCFIFFTVGAIIIFTVLSQQDVQRRKGRGRSVRAPRQKQGLIDTVIGLFSNTALDSNAEFNVLQNVCNFCISGIQNVFEYTSEWMGSTLDLLPRAEVASSSGRVDRERLRASNREEDRPLRADTHRTLATLTSFLRSSFPFFSTSPAGEQNSGEQSEDTDSSQDSSESSLCDYADADKDPANNERADETPANMLSETAVSKSSKNASRKNKSKGSSSARPTETSASLSPEKASSLMSTERKDVSLSTSQAASITSSAAAAKKKIPATVAPKLVSKLPAQESSPSQVQQAPLKPKPGALKKTSAKANPPPTDYHGSNDALLSMEKNRTSSSSVAIKSGEVRKGDRLDNMKQVAPSDSFPEQRGMRRENSWTEVTRERKSVDGPDGFQKANKREESSHPKQPQHDHSARTSNYGISRIGSTDPHKPAEHLKPPVRSHHPGNQYSDQSHLKASSKLNPNTQAFPSIRAAPIEMPSKFSSGTNKQSAVNGREARLSNGSLPDTQADLPPLIHQPSSLPSYGPTYDKDNGSVKLSSYYSASDRWAPDHYSHIMTDKKIEKAGIPPPPGLLADSASSFPRDSTKDLRSPIRFSIPSDFSDAISSNSYSNFAGDSSSEISSELLTDYYNHTRRNILFHNEDSEFWSMTNHRLYEEDLNILSPSLLLPAIFSQSVPGFEEDGFHRDADIFTTGSNTSYDFLRKLVSTPEPAPPSPEQPEQSRVERRQQQQMKGEDDDMDNDYNLTSITKQASALTMLSPDAPSFTPSFKLMPMSIPPNLNYPIQSNSNVAASADFVDSSESVGDSNLSAALSKNLNPAVGFQKWNRSYLNSATTMSLDSPPPASASLDDSVPVTSAAAAARSNPSKSASSARAQSGRGLHVAIGDKNDSF